MVQLKLSFLLSTAVALSLPLAAKAQEKESNFLTCIFQSMSSGNITIEGDLSQVVDSVVASCCPEGTEEPTCTALQCMNYETGTMIEPCTCGEVMTAQQAMKADESLASQINMFMSDAFSSSESVFKACCPNEETSATEVNTCLTDLMAQTVATVSAVETTTEATEPAATTEAATETTSTVANVTPASAPSSGSIASVSLSVMIAYVVLNYIV